MIRIFVFLFSFWLFALLGFSPVLAATSQETSPSAQLSRQINSYELFWPLVAGKVEGDSLYFLKILKENLRGMVIFGPAKKAEYAVLLGTKRVLEAEKLTEKGNQDLATKTLLRALDKYKSAKTNIESIKRNSGTLGPSYGEISNRLSNMQTYLASVLSRRKGEVKTKLEEIDKLIKELAPAL